MPRRFRRQCPHCDDTFVTSDPDAACPSCGVSPRSDAGLTGWRLVAVAVLAPLLLTLLVVGMFVLLALQPR